MARNIFTLIVLFFCYSTLLNAFSPAKLHKVRSRVQQTMLLDTFDHLAGLHQHLMDGSIPTWAQFALQGIADASTSATAIATPTTAAECPAFGQPGWALFCFLRGNPVFNTFDQFQLFIQNSVVSLHDTLENAGIKNAYGPSIILFTIGVRLILFPLLFRQLQSSEKSRALSPKIKEIKEKFPNDQNVQNQLIALLYQETQVNPLAGCLPAIVQIPVFLALYRSFQNLAMTDALKEPFLWLPDLEGPVYGTRSMNWLFNGWHDLTPPLGWEATLAFLTVPILLTIAQTVSLRLLSTATDDPALARTQKFLSYLPLFLGYFSLSFPAGLGIYYVTNSCLATASTVAIKEYFKRNAQAYDIDINKLANDQFSALRNPAWGYDSQEQMIEEARLNLKPVRRQRIPADFV